MSTAAPVSAEARAPRQPAPGLLAALSESLSARVHLLECEVRQAAWAAASLAAFVLAAALLAVAAWLVLAAALVYIAIVAGTPWWAAAGTVIVVHIFATTLLLRRAASCLPRLAFPRSRQALSGVEVGSAGRM